jgi:hypothetical protein
MITTGEVFVSPRGGPCLGLQISSFADRKTASQSVGFSLTARSWALRNCMSLILKTKEILRVGFRIVSNLFIFNNMAERVGFEFS